MWSRAFWIAASERALKSAAQAVLLILTGDKIFDLWTYHGGVTLLKAAVLALVISYLTSLVSMPIGGNGPSVTTVENLTPPAV